MDWEAKNKERLEQIAQERKRLLAMTDAEAEGLPIPDRYQRMRYQREIEAAEWLAEVRRKLPPPAPDQPVKSYRSSRRTKFEYNQD